MIGALLLGAALVPVATADWLSTLGGFAPRSCPATPPLSGSWQDRSTSTPSWGWVQDRYASTDWRFSPASLPPCQDTGAIRCMRWPAFSPLWNGGQSEGVPIRPGQVHVYPLQYSGRTRELRVLASSLFGDENPVIEITISQIPGDMGESIDGCVRQKNRILLTPESPNTLFRPGICELYPGENYYVNLRLAGSAGANYTLSWGDPGGFTGGLP